MKSSVVKPPPPRHKIEKASTHTIVIIPSPRKWFTIIFLGLWAGMISCWVLTFLSISIMFIGLSVGFTFFPQAATGISDPGSMAAFGIILLAFISPFGLFAGYGLYTVAWHIAGKELIQIDRRSLIVEHHILRWTVSKKEYLLEYLSDLRLASRNSRGALLAMIEQTWERDGKLAFDYGAKTFRFGMDLDEAEAKQILNTLHDSLATYR